MLRRSLTVLPFVMLVMTLLAAAPAWAQASLFVDKTDNPDPVAENNVLTYTIEVENRGNAASAPVTLTDELPNDTTFESADTTEGTCNYDSVNHRVVCPIGTLGDEESDTVTIRVRPTSAGTITNFATATDGTTTADDQQNTTVNPNLTIVKDDQPGTAEVGDSLRYNLTVKNRGASGAPNVEVVDELPTQVEFISADPDQGSCDEQPEGVVECDLNNIGAGNTVKVQIRVRALEAGDITNLAQVFAGGGEEAIDEDSETTRVEDDGDGGGGGGGGGGGTGDGSGCQGAQEVDELTGTATEESVEFRITGTKFRVNSDVSNLSSGDSFTITVTDDQGNEVGKSTLDSAGTDTLTVSEGSGQFTVDIDNPGEAQFTVTIDDCTGSDQNGGGGNGGNNGSAAAEGDVVVDDFNDAVAFRCEQVLEISQGSGRNQYNFSAERIDECRRQVVLVDTIPRKVKSLPDTGGSPLALLAAGVLLVSGLLAGASAFRAGKRRGE